VQEGEDTEEIEVDEEAETAAKVAEKSID